MNKLVARISKTLIKTTNLKKENIAQLWLKAKSRDSIIKA